MRLVVSLLPLALACAAGSPDASAVPEQEVVAGPSGAILGEVRDVARGAPLPMVQVELIDESGASIARDLSAVDGRYQLVAPPGTYRVVARRGGESQTHEDVSIFDGDETVLRIDFDDRQHEQPGARAGAESEWGGISGVVLDGVGGEAFAGAVVAASSPGLRDAALAIADAEGRFHFAGLPPGTYVLSCYYHLVERGNVEIRRSGVEVEAGRVTEVELELDLRINR